MEHNKVDKISVIIPTYKLPEYLDICLKSAIDGQVNRNQIIVVVDGTYQENKRILEKYEPYIDTLIFKENRGLCAATNEGVYLAKHKHILIVNDDNVFPLKWDQRLAEDFNTTVGRVVLTPNHIEPVGPIIAQFDVQNLGRVVEEFNLDRFTSYEESVSIPRTSLEHTGSTLPVFMGREDYLLVGGWDENFELGVVADFEFFYKLQRLEYQMLRSKNVHFYHFISRSTKATQAQAVNRYKKEIAGFAYASKKWHGLLKSDPHTNLKTLKPVK